MANLAIKGHPTRGKEVIQLLEMLGGVNKHQIGAIRQTYVYFIDIDNIIRLLQINQLLPEKDIVYSLEEFEEKYPYKVGDNVACYVGLILEKEIHTITEMYWDSNKCRIQYHIDNGNVLDVRDILYSVEYKTEQSNPKEEKSFPPYMDYDIKEEIIEKNQPPKTQEEVDKYLQEHPIKNAMNVMDIESCLETDGLKLSENVVINSKGIGSIQFIQWYEKPQYPKTYVECCNILGIEDRENGYCGYEYELLGEFQQLLICRNAYWKITGEQMGLDKPWEPDWGENDGGYRYCIHNQSNKIILSNEWLGENYILSFPTEEMRDEFYDNFKELIESCKELL